MMSSRIGTLSLYSNVDPLGTVHGSIIFWALLVYGVLLALGDDCSL